MASYALMSCRRLIERFRIPDPLKIRQSSARYQTRSSAWRKVVPLLVKAGRQVYVLEPRGFGDSDKPQGGYDLETAARDLHGFLTATGLAARPESTSSRTISGPGSPMPTQRPIQATSSGWS